MKRGEVRWYRFKAPDKRRPVVVLTRDSILAHLGEVTVAPVTSSIRDIPTEVILDESVLCGRGAGPRPVGAMSDNLALCETARL